MVAAGSRSAVAEVSPWASLSVPAPVAYGPQMDPMVLPPQKVNRKQYSGCFVVLDGSYGAATTGRSCTPSFCCFR